MGDYVQKNVARYLKDTGTTTKLKSVDTPFLDESREPLGCTTPGDVAHDDSQDPVMTTVPKRKKGGSKEPPSDKPPPQFNKCAAGILMQTMYLSLIHI